MSRKYLVETFGCQMNQHDSERMAGLLEEAGYDRTDDDRDADVIVINTCSVREKAEEKLYTRLGEIRMMGEETGTRPVVAVAGCVAQQEGEKLLDRTNGHVIDVLIGTQSLKRLPMLVEEARSPASSLQPPGSSPRIDLNPYDDVSFPLGIARREDPHKAYVTIIEGCNEFCAFCVVPYTRGKERMRNARDIVAEVRHAADTGAREVQLLGQIVNHYQAPDDPGCDFAELLSRVNLVPGIERIRFASPHPRHVTPRMMQAMRDLPKVCRHLHLPVQSGSPRVLRAMNRDYTLEHYLEVIAAARAEIPDLALTTDLIVGFPGETEAEFEETVALVERLRYDTSYAFKYSPRSGTAAARRPDDVTPELKQARLARLLEVQRRMSHEINQGYVGRTLEVLIEGADSKRVNVLARTGQNKIVVLSPEALEPGSFREARIDRAEGQTLYGTLLATP